LAELQWWGWAEPSARDTLGPGALERLRAELDLPDRRAAPVALEDVRLGPSRLDPASRGRLGQIVGDDGVRDDRLARVTHAAGRGYADLVRLRSGRLAGAPDAVVLPSSHGQVAAVLAACTRERVAVVPFGGGTSVVGGVAPRRGELAAVVALDLGRLAGMEALDAVSLTARVRGGTRVAELESALAGRGLTLGHFPQSYELVSVGGCAATRSAGQASTGFGRFDEMVLGLRGAAPAAELALPARPASAAGPDLRELWIGSEGTLGVITELDLRVRPAPRAARYEGVAFHGFAEGIEAFRAARQAHVAPDVARLSDEEETRVNLALAGEGAARRLGGAYLRLRGCAEGALAIVGWLGGADDVAARRAASLALLREHGGVSLGRRPGRAWAATRYAAPYVRDQLLDRGVLAETLETAAQWSALRAVHAAVGGALRGSLSARGTPPLVLCHVSHVYESGASLYFTVLARQQEGAELEQWAAAKDAASRAIVDAGATITHHHAIGVDHAAFLEPEVGPAGLAVLGAAKRELDPAGIMNPGKLLAGVGGISTAG
jgi:alkyldihydroxyacetonephosphate synthase